MKDFIKTLVMDFICIKRFVVSIWILLTDVYLRVMMMILLIMRMSSSYCVKICSQNYKNVLVHFLLNKFNQCLRCIQWNPTQRDHKDRGGPEAGNLQPQFKNSENFAFIFQIRKQQETRKNWIFPSIWSSLWFYVAVLQWKT